MRRLSDIPFHRHMNATFLDIFLYGAEPDYWQFHCR